MSLLSNQAATVGNFQNLVSALHRTNFINGGRIGDWGTGLPGYVITWNGVNKVWEPQPSTSGTNVFVSPVATNNPFYLTFVNPDNGSVPLHTNTDISYNPATQILTVPFADTIASDALNSDNVAVTDDTGTNATYYPTFVASNTGDNNIRVDSTALTYNPFTNTLTCANFAGISTGLLVGNTLTVDAVYGNDGTAAANRYGLPFKTIGAALAAAVSGENVRVNAGTYVLTNGLLIKSGVSLTGAGTQCVVLQLTDPTVNTTLVTMGTSSRVENVTGNITVSASGTAVDITGVRFPAGTSLTATLRATVWNVTYAKGGANTVVGLLSDETSATTYNSSDACSRSTVNVTSNSTGVSRGVYLTSDNRLHASDEL